MLRRQQVMRHPSETQSGSGGRRLVLLLLKRVPHQRRILRCQCRFARRPIVLWRRRQKPRCHKVWRQKVGRRRCRGFYRRSRLTGRCGRCRVGRRGGRRRRMDMQMSMRMGVRMRVVLRSSGQGRQLRTDVIQFAPQFMSWREGKLTLQLEL